MKKNSSNIGGEQSGHIILSDYGNTGDGLVAALQIIACMKEQKLPVSQLGTEIKLLPQLIESVNYNSLKSYNIQQEPKICEEVLQAEKKLGKTGRVVLRPSGTEKKIRIMAECEEENLLNKTIKNLKSRISTLINEYEKN